MSKRHYVMQPDHSYKCVSCRQEFSTRKDFADHCGFRGTCKHPITMGLHLDIDVSPYRWTSNKPVHLSKAA